jgi:hypothetical protein
MKLKVIQDNKDSLLKSSQVKRNRFFLKVLGVGLSVISIGALHVLKEYNRKPVNVTIVKPDFEVTDSALIAEFENSEKHAIEKYSGKIILIKGVIRKIEKNSNTYIFSLGKPFSVSSVHCTIDSTQDAGNWSEGRHITVKGVFVGFTRDELLGSDIILNRCILNYK